MAGFGSLESPTDVEYATPEPPPKPSPKHVRKTPWAGKSSRSNAGGQASWGSSVINLLNTIIGAGVLAMPLALSHMGILLGTFVIVWAGITAGFGLYLQTRCARYVDQGSASFFALSQMTYPKAAVIFDAAIAIKCFGVAVSYLIIIGDLMPGVIQGITSKSHQAGYVMDRHFWVTGFMLVVIPLSFLRRLDSLKYTSVIALVAIGYLVILVLAHFLRGDTMQDRGEVRVYEWAGLIPTLASFPVLIFGYTCHQNMFSIVNEMKRPTPERTASVVAASIGSATVVYVFVAITGYLSFGSKIVGNIVSMYPASAGATIGKAAIVVLVMFSYPLQVHPCRASIDAVLRWRPGKAPRVGHEAGPNHSVPILGSSIGPRSLKRGEMDETRFAIITTVIIVFSYIVAMSVSSLEKVLAYVGSTGSTSISFILPGLFFYKISGPDSPHHQRLLKEDDDEDGSSGSSEEDDETIVIRLERAKWRKLLLRKASLALGVYGIVVMVVCLVTNTFFIVVR